MTDYPKPPFPKQSQPVPGVQTKMDPYPDCGEQSYKGSGRLEGKIALITGGRQRHRPCGGDCIRPGRRGCGGCLLE